MVTRLHGETGHWRRDHLLLALAVSLLGGILLLREFSDPDIWFHLTIGREIFLRGGLPATEFYVFPAISEPAHYPAAGYGLMQYLLFRLGGLPALTAFNALIFAATLYLLYRAGRVNASGWMPVSAILATAIVFWGLNPRFVFRPETLVFLFVALELLLLEYWLRSGALKTLYALPLLSWAITWLHTTWIVLLLVYLAYVAHRAAAMWRAGDAPAARREAVNLAVVAVLMCVLPVLNPYGAAQLEILLASFSGEDNALVEYLPIYSTTYWPHYLAIAGCVALAWCSTRTVRLCDALMVCGFGALAFLTARNIALFALACCIPLTRAASEAPLRGLMRTRPRVFLAVAMVLVLASVYSERNWGFGLKRDSVPEAGMRLIRDNLAPCNVFNFFHFGGYLAWSLNSAFKVAIDGHFVTPTQALAVHDEFFRADPHWRAIAWHYDVCAIVMPATLPYSGMLIPLSLHLEHDPSWRLVAAEGAGLTFIREDLAGGLERLPARHIWEQVVREADATLADYPAQPQALAALRIAHDRLKGN